jgi:hypothetical protein
MLMGTENKGTGIGMACRDKQRWKEKLKVHSQTTLFLGGVGTLIGLSGGIALYFGWILLGFTLIILGVGVSLLMKLPTAPAKPSSVNCFVKSEAKIQVSHQPLGRAIAQPKSCAAILFSGKYYKVRHVADTHTSQQSTPTPAYRPKNIFS